MVLADAKTQALAFSQSSIKVGKVALVGGIVAAAYIVGTAPRLSREEIIWLGCMYLAGQVAYRFVK